MGAYPLVNIPGFRFAPPIIAALALSACMVGPNYERPAAPTPATYKEIAGWTPARPSDAADRTDWWTAFGDPILNNLEERVAASNQSVAAVAAAYDQAHALVAQQRAALYPTVSLNAGAGANGTIGLPTTQSYNLGLGATWAPDLFGRIRRTIESAKANEEIEADDLANARLAAQTEVALDYVQLRQLDEEKRILDATVEAYDRTLTITQNKYKVGVAAQNDVMSALAQLRSTQATDADLAQQRPRLEHAIAILVGLPPTELSLPTAAWSLAMPTIPPGLPATLLQRRPDIAAAERSAASASALIGVQVAAYYPNVTLTGGIGFASGELGPLLSASNAVWSAAGSAAETLFDGGARHAAVAAARAFYNEQVANYRQTVLTAFGQVEDNLAAQRVLVGEQALSLQARDAAARAETIARNEYDAGQVDYTTVVVAQATALSDRNAELQVEAARLTAAVDLIAALGGGWRAAGS
jgi:NodT family efflux transporter outer membrane factor (OMF) lipoprotein